MAVNKKIVVSLPESLLEEFDSVIDNKTRKNRSQFIREAVILYIKERKRFNAKELMKKGYQEMAEINSDLAECGISCDCTELAKYEAVLAESDIIDGTGGEKRRYILC
ncbi:CopG family transcriptional regulator [Fervidicella metallireducens AeB]|uniref:CopG family transcriptional regulator n=1 Tax=Fervidicella metallireducens AeB TaxID=1403537 RepID=A0A017RY33_9CLOT|nr:ribbon-helix-helix protein, CopG family [Fervidicella metallireducens]EYE88855.1 CopG family transcriptional regulator [Fervidicella metallireducens AeB]